MSPGQASRVVDIPDNKNSEPDIEEQFYWSDLSGNETGAEVFAGNTREDQLPSVCICPHHWFQVAYSQYDIWNGTCQEKSKVNQF